MLTDIQWTRRRFVLAAAAGAGALLLPPYLRAATRRTTSAGTLRIGFAGLPPDKRVGGGTDLGMAEGERTATLFGWRLQIVRPTTAPTDIVDDLRALAAGGAQVVVADGSDAEIAAMAPVAERLGVLLVNVVATGDALRGCRPLLFHVAPSRAMLADAAAGWLSGAGRVRRATVAVGSDAVSLALAERFEHRFASSGGAVLPRRPLTETGDGGAASGSDPAQAVVLIAGEQEGAAFRAGWRRPGVLVDLSERAPLRVDEPPAATPMPGVQVVRPAAWHASLERFGADQLNHRFQQAYRWPMEGEAWAGWAAVKIVMEAAMRAGSGEAAAIAAHLTDGTAEFDGQKGWPLSFRPWDHQLRQPIYLVAGDAEGGRVVGELPAGERGGAGDSVRALDALGAARGEATCYGRTG